MNKCDNDDFKRALVRTEVYKLLESGLLQYALTDCDGNRIGQGTEIMLCCPGCGDAPPAGPDNDTTNRSMGWDISGQEISVTDSSNNKVATNILFNVVPSPEAKPVNVNHERFYGKSKSVVLTAPAAWLSLTLEDGSVGKLPAYLDDAVIVPPPTLECQPLIERGEGGFIKEHIDFQIETVVKQGESFQDFLGRDDSAIHRLTWKTYADRDNSETWRQAGRDIMNALGQPESEAAKYEVHLLGRGWINVGDMINFFGFPVLISKRTYGYNSSSPDALLPIFSNPAIGLNDMGVPMVTLTLQCGFQDVPDYTKPTTLYITDGNMVTRLVEVGDAPWLWRGLQYSIRDLKAFLDDYKKNLGPSDVISYIGTPFGIFDFKEAFPTGEIITNDEENGSETSLNTGVVVHFYSGGSYDGNTLTLDRSSETGWILANNTRQHPTKLGEIVHYVEIRVDPAHVSISYDSGKAAGLHS